MKHCEVTGVVEKGELLGSGLLTKHNTLVDSSSNLLERGGALISLDLQHVVDHCQSFIQIRRIAHWLRHKAKAA